MSKYDNGDPDGYVPPVAPAGSDQAAHIAAVRAVNAVRLAEILARAEADDERSTP